VPARTRPIRVQPSHAGILQARSGAGDEWFLRQRREATRQIESAYDAERFVEQVGFADWMTDSRRPGPSLYVAGCVREPLTENADLVSHPGRRVGSHYATSQDHPQVRCQSGTYHL
jgi:hypothetical protein